MTPHARHRRWLAAALLAATFAVVVPVGAQPYPPPPPPGYPAYPPPPPGPPPPVRIAPPPPLSPEIRALYAPFYVAGLAVRYTVYYLIVAPLEVFHRALEYGVSGGVERRDRSTRRPDEAPRDVPPEAPPE